MVSKRCGSASVAGLGIAECDAVLNGGPLSRQTRDSPLGRRHQAETVGRDRARPERVGPRGGCLHHQVRAASSPAGQLDHPLWQLYGCRCAREPINLAGLTRVTRLRCCSFSRAARRRPPTRRRMRRSWRPSSCAMPARSRAPGASRLSCVTAAESLLRPDLALAS